MDFSQNKSASSEILNGVAKIGPNFPKAQSGDNPPPILKFKTLKCSAQPHTNENIITPCPPPQISEEASVLYPKPSQLEILFSGPKIPFGFLHLAGFPKPGGGGHLSCFLASHEFSHTPSLLLEIMSRRANFFFHVKTSRGGGLDMPGKGATRILAPQTKGGGGAQRCTFGVNSEKRILKLGILRSRSVDLPSDLPPFSPTPYRA